MPTLYTLSYGLPPWPLTAVAMSGSGAYYLCDQVRKTQAKEHTLYNGAQSYP